jgi:hypothetical protein
MGLEQVSRPPFKPDDDDDDDGDDNGNNCDDIHVCKFKTFTVIPHTD